MKSLMRRVEVIITAKEDPIGQLSTLNLMSNTVLHDYLQSV